MNGETWFDSRVRSLGQGTRRHALGLLGGGTAAALSRFALQDAEAKKGDKRKKKKKKPKPVATFNLVPSLEAEGCLEGASGKGQIFQLEGTDKLTLSVSGLPANIELEVFIIQAADAPFGLSWYQGDLETDRQGKGTQSFIGRFNDTTAIVAPGIAGATVLHTAQPFLDDNNNNGSQNPVHTFHVGLWFQNAAAAEVAGCPATVTPFAARHQGGIQALKTQDVGGRGPLAQVLQE